jgi:hypothetical protein
VLLCCLKKKIYYFEKKKKPAVGVVDLVTRSAEGLKNTTTYWEEGSKKRVRLPRFIGGDGVMHVFQRHQVRFFLFFSFLFFVF